MCKTILKMMMKVKNISHRHGINSPRSRNISNTRGALV